MLYLNLFYKNITRPIVCNRCMLQIIIDISYKINLQFYLYNIHLIFAIIFFTELQLYF